MKILFDTSVLVAALVEAHPQHIHTLPWLQQAHSQKFQFYVSTHTLAELFSVLTAMPLQPKISAIVANQLIQSNISQIAELVSLSGKEYLSVIQELSLKGFHGGIIYDALIAQAARKAKADYLLTLNTRHFKKVWSGQPQQIISPLTSIF